MFTKLSDGSKVVLWDGDYEVYSKLRYEPLFVGVLHNPNNRVDILKIWDDTLNDWVDCEPGSYVRRDSNGIFHVATKKQVDELRR